jgi:hypothetical protein
MEKGELMSLADYLPRVKEVSDVFLEIENMLLEQGYTALEIYLAFRWHTSISRAAIIDSRLETEADLIAFDVDADRIFEDWRKTYQ